jgi:hypothetical protein
LGKEKTQRDGGDGEATVSHGKPLTGDL